MRDIIVLALYKDARALLSSLEHLSAHVLEFEGNFTLNRDGDGVEVFHIDLPFENGFSEGEAALILAENEDLQIFLIHYFASSKRDGLILDMLKSLEKVGSYIDLDNAAQDILRVGDFIKIFPEHR